MMAFSNSACFFLWAVFLLSYVDAAPAPVAEGDLAHSQALELHTEAGSSRCYYNYQHYEEGDRIVTNEPCLNCTCHKRMLMCYLRVCPFTKPVGQDCTVEKKPDQCCPVITCPEVPVDIVSSSTTEGSTSSYSSAVGHVGTYGCTLEDNTFYPDGVQMPSDPKKPCELCYCIRNHTACVRQECTLNVEGCRPVYQDGVCCPVRYDCDYNEISTTERPSTGGLLLGTTAPSQQCRYGDTLFNDGELIETDKPCESCYCMRGDIVCAVRSCGEPMEGKNCHAIPPPEGQCCPTTFQCENGTISIENMATESSIVMQPSPMENDASTAGPEPQLSAGGNSDGKEEETENKDKETASATEVSPSVSSQEGENQEDKNEEEKVEEHPGENVLSEPTDTEDLEDGDDEEAPASHSDHLDEVSETPKPIVGEQVSTSAPDTSDKEVTQSNNVAEESASESAVPSVASPQVEPDQSEKDSIAHEQESTEDKIKPDDSVSAGTEEENVTGANESVTEKQNIVTDTPVNQEEISKNKADDDSESTEAEVVTQSVGSEQKEPNLEQDSVSAEAMDTKEEIVPTVTSEDEKPLVEPTGEEIKPITIDNAENSQLGTQSTGVEADETKTESNQIVPSGEVSPVKTENQQEKEDEAPTTDENEIKYEETPSKTPESLDQVKEAEISQDNVDTSTGDLSEVHTSEEPTDSSNQDKQEVNKTEEKDEVLANPEKPITDETGPAATPEETNQEDSGHLHKEPAPPRKEDSSPEELAQRPQQHPEGSMTKAEDSIPVAQVLAETVGTEQPVHSEKPDESHEVQGPTDVEKMPVDTTEGSIEHNGVDTEESVHDAGEKEGEVEGQVQTEQPVVSEASSEQPLEHEVNQAIEVPKDPESDEPITTEPAIGTDSSVVINGSDETAAVEKNPTESPSSEGESVPNVIVMEPESGSTDSLPEESSHDEVKPEINSVHDTSSDDEDEHQSLQTEQPVENEKETTVSETEKPTEGEKQPVVLGDHDLGSENIPNESTQSSNKDNTIEDIVKEDETVTQSSMDDMNSSSNMNDNIASSDNPEKESDSVTDNAVISDIPNKSEEKPIIDEPAPSEDEKVSLPTSEMSSPEDEKLEQSHSDTTEKESLVNAVNPVEDNKHEVETPTEPPVEESTDTLIKTGSESKPEELESEKKGEESVTESKPAGTVENPTPVSGLPSEEEHHDPVESEPAEFDENEFAESDDHQSASENEIVDDHLAGHGGAIEHETPSVVPGPVGVIPGEGDCLVDGQTYTNNSNIPSKSPCHKECTCLSSIVHCQGIDCPPPPPELANCMPVHQGDLCCPVYTCDGNTPEGPQSHNQMGGSEEDVKGTEDATTSNINSSGSISNDSDKTNEMPDQAINPTEKIEPAVTPENIANASETQKEDSKPEEHEGADSSSTNDSASFEELHPDNTPQTTEHSVSNVEKEDIKPTPETVLEENKEESGDDKLQAENVTSELGTIKEDSETKPDSEVESSEKVTNEEQKETQHTVLTDQSETQEAESPEQIPTETPIFEESSSKPDETDTDSEPAPSKNEQPQEPEGLATETSHTFESETQEAEGHKEPDVKLETTSETSSEIVDEHLPTITENLTEVNVESSPDDHIHSEEIQPNKESDSPSTDPSGEQPVASIENAEDTTSEKPSELAPDSNDILSENENTENGVQEIVTENPIVGSQDKVMHEDTEVTEEPSESELLVTSKPSLEESNQPAESSGTNEDSSQSESEDLSKPVEESKPQTVDSGSEIPVSEDTATETVFRPTESSLEDRKPEEVGSSSVTKDETVLSATGEVEASQEPKPEDEHNSEESKQDDEHKVEGVEGTDVETVTSHSVETTDAEANQESEPSNEAASSSRPDTEEDESHKTPAPEGPIHDDVGEQNEEVTEITDELHHGISTEAPSFEGPSTKAPSFEGPSTKTPSFEADHHDEHTPLEESKVPDSTESSVSSVGTIEAGNAPESDNLVTDDKPELQEGIQEQNEETSSSSQDNKSENEKDKYEPEVTEASKPNASETSEPTNEIGDHISEPSKQELKQTEHETVQPAHDTDKLLEESSEPLKPEDEHKEEDITQNHEDPATAVQPAHDTGKPLEESSEPLKPEDEHKEEDITQNHEDPATAVHSEEENIHGTEIPTEDITNEKEESVHNESEVHEGVESIDNEGEAVTEPIELVHEDPEQAHEDPESAHEDTESVHEDSEPAHEDNETVHEEGLQTHEDPEQVHEENEPTHEDTESTHMETESPQIETEPAHEENELPHVETEHVQEENEATDANLVPIHDELETVTYVGEAEQSTTVPEASENVSQESENVPQEPELEDVQPTAEIEHPVIETEHPVVESEHADSDAEHTLEPHQQTHEAEQSPDENIIGEGEPATHETEQVIHETDQTMHEIETPHKPDTGSLPTMPGHTIDHSKPEDSKPDDPELPPEDQFTPDVDMDYDVSEDGAFGPGTCRYGGKVYVSAQQIPRDDPCDFCFCFRSDIICLQQSCPPPIHRCHQEPIQGYCCPRYQCPVSMATSLNITTTTSTTTTTLPPHFFAHAYRGAARQSGCFHRGRAYEVGEEITSASGPCLQCICGSDGQMRCDPKVCNPEPMVRKLMEAAVSHRRR